jgi:uncharacterized damage-inducible protein DinB
MDIQTVTLFADYNEKANREMNSFINKTTEEQWNREFNGYFKSIHSLCSHIYIGDFNWLKRFSTLRSFNFIQNQIFTNSLTFDKYIFNTKQEYLSSRTLLDELIKHFAKEVTINDLEQNLTYIDSHGIEYSKNFGGLIIHMFNHETHHRGMISIFLENIGIENDFNSFNQIL